MEKYESLRVGILSTGRMACVMADAINKMVNITLEAVGSRSLEKAESFAEKYGIKKAYGSYERLLSDPDVDIIYIATPHSHHAEFTKLCLDYGKPVLCEKSFTVNKGEAEELCRLSKEKGILLAEAIWVRYMPLAKELRAIVHDGSIGEICSATCNLCYNTLSNPRVVLPEYAGGALLDVGIYCITFLSIIFGDDVKIENAFMTRTETGVDAEDHVLLTYMDKVPEATADGAETGECTGKPVTAEFYSSITGPSDRRGIIYGTKGYIEVGNVNNYEYVEVYDNSHKLIKRINRPDQPGTGYEYQFEACRKALNEGKTECEDMPHEEIIKMMGLMDEIRKKMGLSYPME